MLLVASARGKVRDTGAFGERPRLESSSVQKNLFDARTCKNHTAHGKVN